MTDHPIIFSAPMIVALLAGRKQMTRRLAWNPHHEAGINYSSEELEHFDVQGWNCEKHNDLFYIQKPTPWQRVKTGDQLWVRERLTQKQGTSIFGTPMNVIEAHYAADGEEVLDAHSFNLLPWWKGSGDLTPLYIPRWASRLTLEVTATKIERLAEISKADCIAEGICHAESPAPVNFWTDGLSTISSTPQGAFGGLWEHLHGAGSWAENPELVVLTFRVHRCNIDSMPKARAA